MNTPSPFPQAGSFLGFSAGTRNPASSKFRIVQPNGSAKLSRVLSNFPELLDLINPPPVVLNAYPAMFAAPPNTIFVDCYCRWQTFCAALTLAAKLDRACFVIAMPLTLAHLLIFAVQEAARLPAKIVLFTGGYYCPPSLEIFLTGLLHSAGVSAQIIHLYGVAEIDAGLLAGCRTFSSSSYVLFQSIDPSWQPVVNGGILCFRSASDPTLIVATDDPCSLTEEGIYLNPRPERLSPATRALLDKWSFEDWRRRTGFVAREGKSISFQCRQGTAPEPENFEHEYFDFSRRFGHSWLDKPDWGESMGSDYSAKKTQV